MTCQTFRKNMRRWMAGLAAAVNSQMITKPERKAHVDVPLSESGEYQLRQMGWLPVSEAYRKGLISPGVYEALQDKNR